MSFPLQGVLHAGNTAETGKQCWDARHTMTKPTLILTRPVESAERFAQELSINMKARLDLLFSPLLEIVDLHVKVDLTAYAAVIFSSSNGVRFAPDGGRRVAYCIGQKTTGAAQRRGWDARLMGSTAEQLVQNLAQTSLEGPILHLAGVHQRGDVAGKLKSAGIEVHTVIVYDQRALSLTSEAKHAISSVEPCILPVFSPRTAEILASQIADPRHVIAIALSPSVAAPLAELPFDKVLISDAPTGAAIHKTIENLMLGPSLA